MSDKRLAATAPLPAKTVFDNRGGPRRTRAHAPTTSSKKIGPTTITVRVPLSVEHRGARKLVMTPPGQAPWAPRQSRLDETLIRALARAHRWKRMLENGDYASMTELAAAEDVTESYLCRILRLTLLSPRIVEAILDGTSGAAPQLQRLVRPFPAEWAQQEIWLARV
jgi:hypothetical protein